MSETVAIEIRRGRQEDEAFVFSTWLQATKKSTYEAKRIRDSIFYARRHALFEHILKRGGRVLVAHPEGDPDTILGYIVVEDTGPKPILHFAYTKLPWRRLGIASRLIEHACPDPNQAIFTHWTCWSLAVPAPRGVDRGDRRAVRDARTKAIRDLEGQGKTGGDTEDLLRKWPSATYDPDARWILP